MIRVGIVGNGGIVQQALECFREAGINCSALWCRNAEKGKPVAEKAGIKKVYTDYAEFLEDEDFDTVYIGLVNSMHYEYSLQALQAGKNVICEKPFTSTTEEMHTLRLVAQDRKLFLFEAIMSRYSQNYEAVRDHLKEIGDIKLITANYSQYSRRYDSYLQGTVLPAFDPALSGGALYDINVYNIHFVAGLFGRPEHVQYIANKGYNGIDTSGVVILDYGKFKAVCVGAKDCAASPHISIQGTKGVIETFSRPGIVRGMKIRIYGEEEKTLDVKDEGNPMANEFRIMSRVISNDDYDRTYEWLNASLTVMHILEDARKSAGIEFAADKKSQ